MTFANPHALWLLALLPALGLFFLLGLRAKRRALARFGNPQLVARLTSSASITRQTLKMALFLGGIFWLVIALARPQFGTVVETVRRQGSDLVLGLDVSQSMMAQDLKPNRLVKAKSEIQSLLRHVRGNRVGLVVFAGSAFVQCPLTTDYRAIELFVDAADSRTVARQGTDLGEAIRTTMSAFDQKEGAFRAIVLITDGEDHEGQGVEAAKEAAAAGIRIFPIGIGSTQGEPIPLAEKGSEGGYKKSKGGEILVSRLDARALAEIATLTHGVFHQATREELELEAVYREIQSLERHELYSKDVARYQDQFQVFLALGLLLLMAEWFLSDRRPETAEWYGRFA
ncbi:MAG: VWA domain-containing protein [Candidatus Riflebacteria bacterium]|nr:VWA domain-containing protein [Candidatus Riflebacteria bacterium]